MVVYQIIDLINKEVFFVNNKTKFCEDMGLTVRLLGYTHPSNSEDKLRLHHKGFKYVARLDGYVSNDFSIYEDSELKVVKLWGSEQEICVLSSEVVSIDLYKDCDIELRTKSEITINKDKDVEEKKVVLKFDPSVLRDRPIIGSIPSELEEELAKANKKIQDLQDKLRIVRKFNRLENRRDNVDEHFKNEVVRLLKHGRGTPTKFTKYKPQEYGNGTNSLVVQLSDLHIGKTVNLPNNTFDYTVAQERLNTLYCKLVDKIVAEEIRDITVAFTGDLFNLDSHMDSLLTNEDNRISSFVKGLDIITTFLENLWTHVDNLRVVGVVGNESRVRTSEYASNVDKIANNNLDTLLFAILRRVLPEDIEFLNKCDGLNAIFEVDGYKIAICHGDKLRKHTDEEVLKYKLRMYETYGVMVDYVIFGHIHSTMITPHWGRSGSLVGTDHYYANGLNGVGGVPSQNIYYVTNEGIEGREIKL